MLGSKPNIIFIFAEDMGYNDVSFNGQKNFSTPTLDRMAQEGLILTNHYAGSTVNGPSLATLLTGNHTGRVYQRVNGTIEFRPAPRDIAISAKLQQAAYHTAMIGKSGVAVNSDNATLTNQKGFDHFFGFLSHEGAHRYYPEAFQKHCFAMEKQLVQYPQNEGQTSEVYSGDVILDEALCYLDQQRGAENAFFLLLPIQQPHADLSGPADFLAPYSG